MITWNTDVNAPGCPGEIVGPNGQTRLIQTDWDYCGTASSFGWSVQQVQMCPACGERGVKTDCDHEFQCTNDECRVHLFEPCDHGTDGTVDCRKCGIKNHHFISAAGDWLSENDGAEAEDPGYFTE